MLRNSISRIGALFLLAIAIAHATDSGQTVERTLTIGGIVRTWRLHTPATVSPGSALVIALHPMSTNGAIMENVSGFSAIADREGLLVAYPDSVGSLWDYGQSWYANDDIGFVSAIVDTLATEFAIDRGSVYATGYSAGAIFSLVIATERPDLVAAVAPVAGGMLASEAEQLPPTLPVSVLMMNGTDDRFVPFNGTNWPGVGLLLSAPDSAARWAAADRCGVPTTIAVPNTAPNDGCTASLTAWSDGLRRAEVQLYTIQGGGHTWPGNMQTKFWGAVCMDFNASEVIWRFFRRHGRVIAAPAGKG